MSTYCVHSTIFVSSRVSTIATLLQFFEHHTLKGRNNMALGENMTDMCCWDVIRIKSNKLHEIKINSLQL